MNKKQMDLLAEFYLKVDTEVALLSKIHRTRLQCRRGCFQCCVDDLSVFTIEADNICHHFPQILSKGIPYKKDACALLDPEGACRIYEQRPYVCRTQGLPLRWYSENPGEKNIELRDICPLNETGTPLLEIPAGQIWLIGPSEGKLAGLQENYDKGRMQRVKLRTLFDKK
ncbi:MAG: hypothetical protein E4H13_15795 [Calditrichales bacterium]|nr:MAG: hypothetical protein E4H13_15795 [Calditrichales bacterium]